MTVGAEHLIAIEIVSTERRVPNADTLRDHKAKDETNAHLVRGLQFAVCSTINAERDKLCRWCTRVIVVHVAPFFFEAARTVRLVVSHNVDPRTGSGLLIVARMRAMLILTSSYSKAFSSVC